MSWCQEIHSNLQRSLLAQCIILCTGLLQRAGVTSGIIISRLPPAHVCFPAGLAAARAHPGVGVHQHQRRGAHDARGAAGALAAAKRPAAGPGLASCCKVLSGTVRVQGAAPGTAAVLKLVLRMVPWQQRDISLQAWLSFELGPCRLIPCCVSLAHCRLSM